MTQTATPTLLAGEDTGRSDAYGITNIKMPTFVGTVAANAVVTLYDTDGSVLGTGTANASGYYTIVLSQALNEGGHLITATVTAPGDTTSQSSAPLALTEDSMAPDAPAAPILIAAADTGISAEDGITATKMLEFTGLAEPNALVQLYNVDNSDPANVLSSAVLASAIAGSDGTYTLTTGPLADGSYKFEVTATDVAGNVAPISKDTAFTAVTIDSAAPATPAAPMLDAGSDTGVLHSDGLTNDDTPVITGSAEAGATVELFNGSVMLAKAKANDSGAYAITAPALADGAYALTVKAVDAAGNTSAASAALNIVVDTTAPTATSTPAAVVEEAGSLTFTLTFSEQVTGVDVSDFKLVTTGSAFGTVQSVSGAGAQYIVTVNGLGGTGTVALQLAGQSITDLAGNAASLSLTESHAVAGTNAPLTTLVSASVSGNASTAPYGAPSASGRLVAFSSDTALVPTGATAGVNNIYVKDLQTGALVLVSSGDLDLPANGGSVGPSLSADGTTIAFATTATNMTDTPTQAGETNIYIAKLTIGADGITIDPNSYKLLSAGNGQQGEGQNSDASQAEYAPILSSDGSTVVFDSTQALVKGAESGIENVYAANVATGAITLVSGGTGQNEVAYEAAVTAGGIGYEQLTAVANRPPGEGGDFSSDVTSVSADGNLIAYESTATDLGGAPINLADNLVVTRAYVYNMTTGVTTPLDGTTLYDPTATEDTDAYQTYDPVLSGDGTKVTYNVNYMVGNTPEQATYQYNFVTGLTQSIATSSPANPDVYDFGTSASKGGGLLLYQNNPGIYAGTDAYQIILDSTGSATQTIFPAGYAPLLTTSGDAFTFVAQPQGASSAELFETSFNVSAGVAAIGTDDELNAQQLAAAKTGLVVSGTSNAPAGATVLVQFFGASATNTGNAPVVAGTMGSNGQWRATMPVDFLQAADGQYALVLQIGTPDGNSFYSVRDFTVDTKPPATPDAPALAPGADTSTAGDGSETNQDRPVLTGTAEAGATITLYDTGGTSPATAIGTALADANGVYSITPGTALINGKHSLEVTATDEAGNVSDASAAVSFTVDTLAPAQPTLLLAPDSDTGASNSDGITKNNSPTVTGIGEAGTTITLYDTDGVAVLGTVTVARNGTWSLASNNLADGVHSLTVTDTDAAGNVSPRAAPLQVTIDTTPPFAPVIDSVNGVLVDGALAPLVTVSGTAAPGTIVTLRLDGGSDILGTTTAAVDGDYSLESDPLPAGAHSLSVVSTDLAGNDSQQSLQTNVTITDNAVPPPGAPPSTPSLTVQLTDGPIAGAIVFADTSGTGVLTAQDGSAVTNAEGQAKLADTGGALIATGGVDSATGLSLDGDLTAPAHSTVISPLTTLLAVYTSLATGKLAADEAALAKLLGLQATGTTTLTALDPTAAALSGSAALDPAIAAGAPLIESAKIIDTASEFAAFLKPLGLNINDVIAQMASIAAQTGGLDLDNAVTLNDILAGLLSRYADYATASVVDAVVEVAAATNANLDKLGTSGAGLVTAVTQVEAVAQGQVSSDLYQLSRDSGLAASIVAQFTGATLYDATSASVALLNGAPQLAPGDDTGRSGNDNMLDDATPTFTGQANPGTYVTLFQYVTNGSYVTSTVVIGTGIADASGHYSIANAALILGRASGGTAFIAGPVGAVGSSTAPGVTIGQLITVPANTPTTNVTLDQLATAVPEILDATVAAAPGDDAAQSALLVYVQSAEGENYVPLLGTYEVFADGGTTPIGIGTAAFGDGGPSTIITTPLTLGQHQLTVVEIEPGGTAILGSKTYAVTVGAALVTDGVDTGLGRIAGATIYDTPPKSSSNSSSEVSEVPDAVTAVTDTQGHYTATLDGSGDHPIASANGYDTLTGLAIGGDLAQFGGKLAESAALINTGMAQQPTLYAPYGFNAVSSLTTLLYEMDALDNIAGGPTPADNNGNEAKLLAGLGLSSSLDLATLDPVAAAQSGDTAPLLIEAKLLDTVTLLSPFFSFDFRAIAAYIANSGSIDLDSASAVDTMLADYYGGNPNLAAKGITNDKIASLAAAIAASNSAIATQAAGASNLAALLAFTLAAQTVAQGAETADLLSAAGFGAGANSPTVAEVATKYSGAALLADIAAAQAQETQAVSFVADGPATTSAATVDFTITFSKPVSNVSAAIFSVIAGNGVTGAHITGVTPVAGSGGASYLVAVSTGVGTGTLALRFSGAGLLSATGAPITNGLFAPAVTTVDPAGAIGEVAGIAVGDFNGDGLADVVMTGDGVYGATIYMNNGNGTYTAQAPIAGSSDQLSEIAVGDVNGDGKLDIIEAGADQSGYGTPGLLSVALGNGDGTFQTPIYTPIPSETMATGDFTGNGRTDLAVSTATGLEILLSNGDGSFTTGQSIAGAGNYTAIQAADLTGNGNLDLVATNDSTGTVSIFLGDGHGGFIAAATPTITTAGAPEGIAIGDVNGDGIPDIAVTCIAQTYGASSSVQILLGQGNGAFTALAPFNYAAAGDTAFLQSFAAGSVAIGDVNNDGKPDLVLGGGGGTVVLDGNGDGTFTLGYETSEGTTDFAATQAVALADVNGDGRTDILEPGDDQNYGGEQSTPGLDVLINQAPPVIGSASTQVTIARDSLAVPVIAKRSGAGTLIETGTTYALNLGTIAQGAVATALQFAVSNAASGAADALAGSFEAVPSAGFTVSGATLPQALLAGESYDGLTVTLDTGSTGTHTQTIVLAPLDISPTTISSTGIAGTDSSVSTTGPADGASVAAELPAITLVITDTVTPAPVCYLRGTRILTVTGEKNVEDLQIGDLLPTRFGGVRPIKWIGRQSFSGRFTRNNWEQIPVRIRAGALGAGLPRRDLFVSPGHSLLLDGQLILAKALINGVTILQDAVPAEIHWYEPEFATHDCLQAEGLWAESFADGPGLRARFHNHAAYHTLYPRRRAPSRLRLCAPRPQHGPALEARLLAPVQAAARLVRPGPLRGCIDRVTPGGMIEGWAQDIGNPELPVRLEILLHGRRLGTALACHYRADLAAAGLGKGRCQFVFRAQRRFSPTALAGLQVRRIEDGAALAGLTRGRAA